MGRATRAAAAVAAFALAAVAGAAAPEPASVVFSSTRASDYHDEIYLLDTQTGARRSLSRSATVDVAPAVSPDGRWVAFASDREGRGHGVWLARTAGGGAPKRLRGPRGTAIEWLTWSPDGDKLAVLDLSPNAAYGSVSIVLPRGGAERRIGRGLAVHWLTPRVLVVVADGVTARDVSGRILWRRRGYAPVPSSRGELALADGRRLHIVGADGRTRVSVRAVGVGVWSADGTRHAYPLTVDGGIGVLERVGAGYRRRILGRGIIYPRSWSPDGRRLLASAARGIRPVIVSLDGRTAPVGVADGVWAKTGATVVGWTDRGLAAWRPGRPARLLVAGRDGPCSVQASAIQWLDGRRLVLQLGRGSKGQSDLWTTTRTGAQPRRLVRSTSWESAPEWSPDGERVVYESGDVHTHADQCSGPLTPHLRIVGADGSGDRALTPKDTEGHFQQAPRWSPDGSKVAFHQTDLGEIDEFGVFVVDVSTGTLQRLTTGYGEGVSWSPDGRRVAFSGRGVSVADLRTGTVTRIGPGERAEWSPDGTAIAHVRGGDLWLIAPDGSDVRRIVDTSVVGDIRWAPDGKRLAFGLPGGIRVVDRDGVSLRTIRQPGASRPRFSRDGRTLAFVVAADENGPAPFGSELYVAEISTGRVLPLTRDRAAVGAPSWR